MSSENSKYDETRKVILSLLLARKGATSVSVVDQDYYEIEGEYIPYHRFGYADLVAFFRSMPQYFKVEQYSGRYYVCGIASEKSKHVSSLVARQKHNPKMKNSPNRRLYQVSRYAPRMQRQCNRIPAEKMHFLVQYMKNYPDGLSIQNVMTILQKQLPLVMLTVDQVRRQLRELSHQLTMDGEMIYPVSSNVSQESKHYQKSPILMPQTRSAYHQTKVACTAEEKNWVEEYDSDQNSYLSDDCESNDYLIRRSTNKRLATNFAQNINHKQTFENNDYKKNKEIDNCFTTNNCNNINDNKDGAPSNGHTDMSTLISDRTRSRLKQLLRKYPEGIYCAELPDMYFSEYKVHLNYAELGFSSVHEYVSYLPNIFYVTCVNATDDFMLFSANKRPTIPNQKACENQTKFVKTKYNDDAAIPKGIVSYKLYSMAISMFI
jgi:tudor domain-containing protein 5